MLSPNRCQYSRDVGRRGEAILFEGFRRAKLKLNKAGFDSPEPDFNPTLNRLQKRLLGHLTQEAADRLIKLIESIAIECKTRTHDYPLRLRHARSMVSKFLERAYRICIVVIVGSFPTRITPQAQAYLTKHKIRLLTLEQALTEVMLCMSGLFGLVREGAYRFTHELGLILGKIESDGMARLRRLYDKVGRYLYDAHRIADTTHPTNPLKIHLWQRVGSDDLWGLL
jgi:hypothetical protein